MIAVVGITHTCQGATQRDSGHIKGTTQRGGHACIHILYTLGTVVCARGREVDLQITDRLQERLDLQILGHIDISRCSSTVILQQPVAFQRLVDIAIAYQTKGEVETWRQRTVLFVLSQHVAHIRHEARQQQRVLVTIADIHAAQHHQDAQHPLVALIRFLQGRHMVIERHQIEGAVKSKLTVAGHGVPQTGAILQFGAAHPRIAPGIGGIGIHPVKDGQLIEWQLIRSRYLLLVVERRTPVTDALLHRVFPSHILVGIQVFIDGGVRFLYLCPCGRLETEMQVLGEIPAQREVTVPQELF